MVFFVKRFFNWTKPWKNFNLDLLNKMSETSQTHQTRKILNFIRKRWNTVDERNPFSFTTKMDCGTTIEAFCVDLVVTNRGQIKNR